LGEVTSAHPTPLTLALLHACGRAHEQAPLGFEKRLAGLLAHAQTCAPTTGPWPDLTSFATFVGERLQNTPLTELEQLALDDLALAFVCLRNDPRALELLEQRCLSQLTEQLQKAGFSREIAEETRQRLSEKLLVGSPAQPPRLASFSGRSSLAGWLRVVALREAVKAQHDQHPHGALTEDALELSTAEEDPELKLFKSRFRVEFAEAFRLALEGLPAHERLILRQYFIDELSIDQLAALHQVHRSTSARWVAHARAVLVSKVKRSLQYSLKVEASEVSRLVRAVRSGFDLSLRRFL
jgi:RNA polymerase sigma-70 factor (ECF subfamily)